MFSVFCWHFHAHPNFHDFGLKRVWQLAVLRGDTVAMPKKVKGCTISEIVASADEIQEAKKALGQLSDKAIASKKNCLRHFLTQNPDAEAEMARGEGRMKYLELYLSTSHD